MQPCWAKKKENNFFKNIFKNPTDPKPLKNSKRMNALLNIIISLNPLFMILIWLVYFSLNILMHLLDNESKMGFEPCLML